MALKNIPVGIEDFAQVASKYYVDKTIMIKELIDSCFGRSILVTRPRRFGKSLTLSMLQYYFSNRLVSGSLFANKKIHAYGDAYLSHMNAYPVIRLNMKNISHPTYKEMIRATIEDIAKVFRDNRDVLDNEALFPIERDRFNNIAGMVYQDPFDYVDAIEFLCDLLFQRYNKRVIVLIDEYDTPLENAQNYGFYDQAIEFYKRLYSSTLKANDYLLFSFSTGVLQISKESIFSELNNLSVFSLIDEPFSSYYGFTKQEVIQALQDFHVQADIDELNKYYGGYGLKGEIYNPWSILNFLANERIDLYWTNSGSNKAIASLIEAVPNAVAVLNEFIGNSSKTFAYKNSLTYSDVKDNYETLFSYLVQSGYLSARPSHENLQYELRIPNEETRIVLEEEIILRNLNKQSLHVAKRFRESLLSGDVDFISSCLKDYVFDLYSYYDGLQGEKSYQNIIVATVGILFSDYLVKPEVNGKYGRCDIMLFPKNKKDVGMIIEIKKYKNRLSKSRLDYYSLEAIEQIKGKSYYQELLRYGCEKILLYGFAFDDYSNSVSKETLNVS